MMIWFLLTVFTDHVFNMVSDGSDLGLIACFANDKKIGYRFVNLTQIKGDNILPFLILYSGNDGFDNL